MPVGPELIGRVVDSLGQPIDGKGPVNAKMTDVIEKVAPGVIWRKSVSQPVQTGLKAIDAMVPIGRGQRELIIGDRQTGKTAVAIDTIINQKGKDLICVYVAIGQKASIDQERDAQARGDRRDGVHDRRRRDGVGIGGDAVHRAVLGLHDGRVLPRPRRRTRCIIYDDLTKQAWAYRQISLLLRRAAGPRGVSGRRVLSALAPARARARASTRSTSRSSPRARSRARPDRSPRCRSSRRRRATSPRSCRPT